MKVYLVTEEVVSAVVNFIGSKHTYVEAKPFIEALQSSQTAEAVKPPAEEVTDKTPVKEADEKETS